MHPRLWPALLVLCAGTSIAAADDPPDPPFIPTPASTTIDLGIDSGWVRNLAGTGKPEVVFWKIIEVPGAEWLRLHFRDVTLAGNLEVRRAAYLRLTSVKDGDIQYLDAYHLPHYNDSSAFFNGDAVLVELVAYPKTTSSRIVIDSVTAGEPSIFTKSICGPTDDRQLSSNPRAARHSVGCTSWLWNDHNNQFHTAGHCGASGSSVMSFNVPLSNPNGSLNQSAAKDQYPVNAASVASTNGGVGNDWLYFGCLPNSNTGLTAFQAQGACYTLGASAPGGTGQNIDITGYGTVSSPVSPTWNQVQKVHVGPYQGLVGTAVTYRTDTTGGNSGSPVLNADSGLVIGVHTHGGCTTGGGANQGTALQNNGWAAARNAPKGVCSYGWGGAIAGPVYVTSDLHNKFGSLSRSTGKFDSFSGAGYTAPYMNGLAYDPATGHFFATDITSTLYTIDPSDGSSTALGALAGAIHGLAYDPWSKRLFGMDQANGQLYLINPNTLARTPIGTPKGGNVGGIDFDPAAGILYGVDDGTGSASRIITINTSTGAHTIVGNLGASIVDTDGLAFCPADGFLYTINDANEQFYRVNPATGAATLVGNTGSAFGVGFGMASSYTICLPDCERDGDLDIFDFLCFQGKFAAQDPYADFEGDGDWDVFDFLAYQGAYASGC